jgi:hypothetical protein
VASGIDTTINYDVNSNDSCVAASTAVRDVVIPNFVAIRAGSGARRISNSDEYTLDSKLDYTYGSGSRIFVSGKMSRNQGRDNFGGGKGWLYNPQGFSGALGKSKNLTLGWTHNFVRTSESALSIDLKVARQFDHAISGNLDPSFDLAHRDPSFGFVMPDFRFQVDPRCESTASGCIPFTVDESWSPSSCTTCRRRRLNQALRLIRRRARTSTVPPNSVSILTAFWARRSARVVSVARSVTQMRISGSIARLLTGRSIARTA